MAERDDLGDIKDQGPWDRDDETPTDEEPADESK